MTELECLIWGLGLKKKKNPLLLHTETTICNNSIVIQVYFIIFICLDSLPQWAQTHHLGREDRCHLLSEIPKVPMKSRKHGGTLWS